MCHSEDYYYHSSLTVTVEDNNCLTLGEYINTKAILKRCLELKS